MSTWKLEAESNQIYRRAPAKEYEQAHKDMLERNFDTPTKNEHPRTRQKSCHGDDLIPDHQYDQAKNAHMIQFLCLGQ